MFHKHMSSLHIHSLGQYLFMSTVSDDLVALTMKFDVL